MAKFSAEELVDKYLDWYKQKTTINQLRNANEIYTPFKNHLNDRIGIYTQIKENNSIFLSDDGVTLDELSMMALNYETKPRQKILDEILTKYNIELEDGILFTCAKNINEFPQKKHDLIQAILSVYDMLQLNNKNIKSIFKDEVFNFFFENDFGGNEKPKFSGESGIIHSLDYSLGATTKRPNILFQFIRKPDFDNVAAQQFIANDLYNKPQFKSKKTRYVIICENNIRNNKAQQAADYAGIDLLPFSDKEQLKLLK